MAYSKFIGSIESAKLLKEIEQNLIFAKNCTREYEGEVKEKGDQITIRGLGEPTIYTVQKDGTYLANAVATGSVGGSGKDVIQKGLPDPEEITGGSVKININQINAFNFMVGDIDKEMTKTHGLLGKYRTKSAKRMANEVDKYIAKSIVNFADSENESTENYTAGTGTYLTSGDSGSKTIGGNSVSAYNILDFIDEIVELFNSRDYGDNVKFGAEVSPKFWRCLKKALRKANTDNSKLLEGREITNYNGIDFMKTNNAVVSTVDYAIVRNKDAVGFFNPTSEMEAYKIYKGFGDGVKAYTLYDVGILAPKAMVWSKILGYSI